MSTILDTLRGAALELALLREEESQRSTALKAKREAFEQTIAEDVTAAKAAKAALEQKDAEVRSIALIAHEQTGDNKPCAGIEIMTIKKYLINDTLVIAHAKAHAEALPGLIEESLNLDAVKKIAAAGVALPGVIVENIYSVRIATDLVKALSEVTV